MQNSGLEDILLHVQSQEKWFVCSCRVTGMMGLKRRPKCKALFKVNVNAEYEHFDVTPRYIVFNLLELFVFEHQKCSAFTPSEKCADLSRCYLMQTDKSYSIC